MKCYVLSLFLLAATALGQQAPPEPASVTFRAQGKLVLLSFHVRKKNYVRDLPREGVILLEDGKPRDFTIFDSPATEGRIPLELVLLFDDNPKINSMWDPDKVFLFAPKWDEEKTRAILTKESADIRISVYRCAGRNLFRLSPATADPRQVTDALRAILKPMPDSAGIPLSLPLQRARVDHGPMTDDFTTSHFAAAEARGWPLDAAIATLNDAAAAGNKVSRAMVMFSEGIGATSTIPEDVANEALDLGIPIYPVATNYHSYITDALPRNLFRMRQFEALGKMTGGRAAEYAGIEPAGLSKILESIISEGLSQYVIGFVPPSGSGAGKTHTLEVKVASKALGDIEGGKRRAIY